MELQGCFVLLEDQSSCRKPRVIQEDTEVRSMVRDSDNRRSISGRSFTHKTFVAHPAITKRHRLHLSVVVIVVVSSRLASHP